MLLGFLGLAAVSWFGLLLYVCTPSYARGRKAKRLGNRPSMTADDFYRLFYASSGISQGIVIELLSEIANAVEIPRDLLRPSDRFDHELRDLWKACRLGGSGELYEMDMCALDRAERLGLQLPTEGFETVYDYVKFFGYAAMVSQSNPARTASSSPAAPCG